MKIIKEITVRKMKKRFKFKNYIEHCELRKTKEGRIIFNPYGFGYERKGCTDYYIFFYESDLKRKAPKPDLFRGVVSVKDAGGFLGECSFVSSTVKTAIDGAIQKAKNKFLRITDIYIGAVYFRKWQDAVLFAFWYLRSYRKEKSFYPTPEIEYKDGYYVLGVFIKEIALRKNRYSPLEIDIEKMQNLFS